MMKHLLIVLCGLACACFCACRSNLVRTNPNGVQHAPSNMERARPRTIQTPNDYSFFISTDEYSQRIQVEQRRQLTLVEKHRTEELFGRCTNSRGSDRSFLTGVQLDSFRKIIYPKKWIIRDSVFRISLGQGNQIYRTKKDGWMLYASYYDSQSDFCGKIHAINGDAMMRVNITGGTITSIAQRSGFQLPGFHCTQDNFRLVIPLVGYGEKSVWITYNFLDSIYQFDYEGSLIGAIGLPKALNFQPFQGDTAFTSESYKKADNYSDNHIRIHAIEDKVYLQTVKARASVDESFEFSVSVFNGNKKRWESSKTVSSGEDHLFCVFLKNGFLTRLRSPSDSLIVVPYGISSPK